MSRRRYRYPRSDPIRELLTTVLGLFSLVCVFLYLYWTLSQPGAFNIFPAPTPTRSPSQPQPQATEIPFLLLLSVCAILIAVVGLPTVGLVWWRQTKHQAPATQSLPPMRSQSSAIGWQTVHENSAKVSLDSSSNKTGLESVQNLISEPDYAPGSTEGPGRALLSVSANSPMSNSERAFFTFLDKAVKGDYQIFPQMPLKRLVKRKGMLPTNFYAMLENGSVDFVLANPKYLNPVLAIELDDSSHLQATTKERDQIKEALLKEAQIPLLHFRVVDRWDSREIRRKIDDAIG